MGGFGNQTCSRGSRPYETGGHWISTVDGWAWASDYNWGWAPFHYGRWFYDQSIGWAWVPGYEWAPAWVTWGQYNDYYAWAPLAPGINISTGNSWRAPGNYWSFVPRNCISYTNLNRYASYGNYGTNVNNITIINNYNSYNQKDYYHRGPDYREVSRFTHKPISPVSIASSDKPGLSRVTNKQFQVYRPVISPNSVNNNNSVQGNTSTNNTRPYKSGVLSGNGQTETSVNADPNRNVRNPNLNNLPKRNSANGIPNGSNSVGGNVSQQDIDNSNRRFQQQQMERVRGYRNQPAPAQTPAAASQNSQNNQQPGTQVQQDIMRRQQEIRYRNNSGANNSQPARPQPRLQDERIMQRPSFPQENERIMRQPQSPPSMPQRVESRESNPARSMESGRPAGGIQRPPRF